MSSFDYAKDLFERAKEFFNAAKNSYANGFYNAAAVEAEIAAQLAVKAVIAKAGFEYPRTHSIRKLLSFIVENRLFNEDVLNEIREFIRVNRDKLILLERLREVGQYGRRVEDDEAKTAIEACEKVIELATRLWEMVK